MQPSHGTPLVHLLFLAMGIIFYIYILIDAGIRKKGNVSNELIVGTMVFLLILGRFMVGMGLLHGNGVVYAAFSIQILATITVLLWKPNGKRSSAPTWQQSLKISGIILGMLSILSLIIAGFMAYSVFGSTMPSSVIVILLGNIPFLVAVAYKYLQFRQYNDLHQ